MFARSFVGRCIEDVNCNVSFPIVHLCWCPPAVRDTRTAFYMWYPIIQSSSLLPPTLLYSTQVAYSNLNTPANLFFTLSHVLRVGAASSSASRSV